MPTRTLFIVLALQLFIMNIVCGQTSYPKGVYTTHKSLYKKKPKSIAFAISKRPLIERMFFLNNEYRVRSAKDRIKRIERFKNWHAVSDGQHLYINGIKAGAQGWYSKVEGEGRYLMFEAGLQSSVINPLAFVAGFSFGLIGWPIFSFSLFNAKQLYYYDSFTGEAGYLSKEKLKEILKQNQTLLHRFEIGSNKGARSMKMFYLNALNDSLGIHYDTSSTHYNAMPKKVVFLRDANKEVPKPLRFTAAGVEEYEMWPNSVRESLFFLEGKKLVIEMPDGEYTYVDLADMGTSYIMVEYQESSYSAKKLDKDDGEWYEHQLSNRERKRLHKNK